MPHSLLGRRVVTIAQIPPRTKGRRALKGAEYMLKIWLKIRQPIITTLCASVKNKLVPLSICIILAKIDPFFNLEWKSTRKTIPNYVQRVSTGKFINTCGVSPIVTNGYSLWRGVLAGWQEFRSWRLHLIPGGAGARVMDVPAGMLAAIFGPFHRLGATAHDHQLDNISTVEYDIFRIFLAAESIRFYARERGV